MKKTMKKILCTVLVVVLCLTSAPLSGLVGFNYKAEATNYKVGDVIQFGSYPQSEVKDTEIINALNNLAPEWDKWTSYGYYSGDGSLGSMVQGDYMRYIDITYSGDKYRGVKFTQYRPYRIYERHYAYGISEQEENGYYTNVVYWFKFEPILWRVLDPQKGLVISETIIDTQSYVNTIYSPNDGTFNHFNDPLFNNYASDYETSYIRQWLNEDFYSTAFENNEKSEISVSILNNDSYKTSNGIVGYERFDSNETKDKVFLLSYSEVKNSEFGFDSKSSNYDFARRALSSDYAACQGLNVNASSTYKGNSWWLLRSPGDNSLACCYVFYNGDASLRYNVYGTNAGIRPAICLNRISSIVNPDQPIDPENPDIPETPDTPDVPDETKSIAILTTNKSFCIEPDDSMWVAFGIVKEDGLLEENWRKMAVSVSDPTIVALSEYEETEYGYSLEIKGKKEGSTNIVVTDTETGLNEVFRVTVCDDFSKSTSFSIENPKAFYPSNKYELDILTNIYDMNGLYVNNYKCVKTSEGYDVTFDVYNQRYHTGAVDVFDKDGNWVESVEIEKYSEISSLYDTGEQIYYMVFGGSWMTYQHAMHSKKTSVEIEVPDGGYFIVSNNFAESIGTFFFNSAEIFYEGVSVAIDLFASNIDAEPFIDLIFKKFDETPTLKKAFQDIFTSSLDKEIRDISQNILKENAEDAYITIADLFENILSACKIEWKHLVQIASGVGEGAFEKFAGPAGLVLQSCFTLSGYTNKILNARHLATSTNKSFATFYSEIEDGFINPNGVYINDNGNVDAEAVLQVFRISDDDSISELINPSDVYELYNICFVKDDKLVQPNGKVKVLIPIPANMRGDTCTIYRQEKDGSWTPLQAKKEGSYLVFETDHFSLYAIIGKGDSIEVNSLPHKITYEPGEMLDLNGLSIKLNGAIINQGFVCSPSVLSDIGKQTITVNYMGLTTDFEVKVEAHKHTINDDGKCTKCGVDVTVGCSCNCHKGGIAGFFFKLILFFQKLFKTNKNCSCGVNHY